MTHTTQHTPGPWTVPGDGHESERTDGSPWRRLNVWAGDPVTGKGLQAVAQVEIPMGEKWSHGEARANATLIAAAPELLSQLEREVDWLRHIKGQVQAPNSVMMGFDQAIKYMSLAITKAKGGV